MVTPLMSLGRLGNFLFQAATAIAYALDHGIEFSVPDTTTDARWRPVYLQHLVNPKWNPKLPKIEIAENQHNFKALPWREEWRNKNILLHGYFQTEKYFAHHRDKILELFALPWEPLTGWVSVHVRRGDYLIHTDKHPPVPVEWIAHAMNQFPGAKFMFFSDDIDWCKNEFIHRMDCSFSEGQNEMQDLTLGSWCEHHICSASTFSWWQCWLSRNENMQAIFPKLWLCPGWGGLDLSDVLPARWESFDRANMATFNLNDIVPLDWIRI